MHLTAMLRYSKYVSILSRLQVLDSDWKHHYWKLICFLLYKATLAVYKFSLIYSLTFQVSGNPV